jgi:hypothetical protein
MSINLTSAEVAPGREWGIQTVACVTTGNRCIPDKNTWGWIAVVSCAFELISMFLCYALLELVNKFFCMLFILKTEHATNCDHYIVVGTLIVILCP